MWLKSSSIMAILISYITKQSTCKSFPTMYTTSIWNTGREKTIVTDHGICGREQPVDDSVQGVV